MSITEKELFARYGIELERLRSNLADTLIGKGIDVSSTATFQELVPQVSNVSGITPCILTSNKIEKDTNTSMYNITKYINDNAVLVDADTFRYASNCSYIDLPNVLELGEEALAYWNYSSTDVQINIPNLEIIRKNAFKSSYAVHNWFTKNGGQVFENVTTICSGAFSSLMAYAIPSCTFTFPKVISLDISAFGYCVFGSNNVLNFPELTTVASNTFKAARGSNYFSIYLPKVSTIHNLGFANQSVSGNDVYFSSDTIKTLYSRAFYYGGWGIGVIGQSHADILNTTISIFNQVGTIPDFCFCGFSTFNEQGIEFMNASIINANAFETAKFTSINFNPDIPITIYSSAFKSVSCPINNLVIKTIYSDAFSNATNFTSAYIYSTSRISGTLFSNAFRNARNLSTISGYIRSIPSGAFYNCSQLRSLYLYNTGFNITTLTVSAYGAFYGTPIYSGSGSIYVPASLYDTYISATNWATLSDAFVSVADM